MAAVAERAARPGRAAAAPRRRPSRRRAAGRRVTGGVVWIGIVAALLAGVVTLNVAVLQLNLRMDRANGERARLRAENAALQSQLSSESASGRIEALAQRKLGTVRADPSQTTYIDLGR